MGRHTVRVRLGHQDSENIEGVIDLLRKCTFIELRHDTEVAFVSAENRAQAEDTARIVAHVLLLRLGGHELENISVVAVRQAMLGEEADGQEYLVPEERWSSKCRTCKSLLGVVCSSSARVKFFGEGGRDHIDLVQHAYDESRSMLFIGASSLVKGAIDIMFDPGRVCYVDLRVRPNVDHLAGITGIAVPGTKVKLDMNVGRLRFEGPNRLLNRLVIKYVAVLAVTQSDWCATVPMPNLVAARYMTSKARHNVIATMSGCSGDDFGLVMAWDEMFLMIGRLSGNGETVGKVTGAIEQILQTDCTRFVSVALDANLVDKASTARTEYLDGSVDHQEVFVAELAEQTQLPLQRDGAYLMAILPSGVDPGPAQRNLEEKVKELGESLSRAGAEGQRRAKRARLSDRQEDGGRGGVRGAASSFFAAVTQAVGAWFRPRTAPPEHVAQ